MKTDDVEVLAAWLAWKGNAQTTEGKSRYVFFEDSDFHARLVRVLEAAGGANIATLAHAGSILPQPSAPDLDTLDAIFGGKDL